MELTRAWILLVSLLAVPSARCSSDNNTATKPVNGEALVAMGRKYNKPILMLIGKSLLDLECSSGACSSWSAWSSCEWFVGQFGMKKRWRQCRDGCQPGSTPVNDTMTAVCFCPEDYQQTKEGFCFKLYTDSTKTKADAEAVCKADGGFLININSQRKWDAYVHFMDGLGRKDTHYIDGQRKSNVSPWVFSYEGDVTGYTNWGDNDPDNGSTELCLVVQITKPVGVYDTACTRTLIHACEIV